MILFFNLLQKAMWKSKMKMLVLNVMKFWKILIKKLCYYKSGKGCKACNVYIKELWTRICNIMAFATSKEKNGGNKAYFDPAIYPRNKDFDCEGWSKLHLDITKKLTMKGIPYLWSLTIWQRTSNDHIPIFCSFGRQYEGHKQKKSEWDGNYIEHSINNDRKNNRKDGLKLDRKIQHFRIKEKAIFI